jgi:hypothetical protein
MPVRIETPPKNPIERSKDVLSLFIITLPLSHLGYYYIIMYSYSFGIYLSINISKIYSIYKEKSQKFWLLFYELFS